MNSGSSQCAEIMSTAVGVAPICRGIAGQRRFELRVCRARGIVHVRPGTAAVGDEVHRKSMRLHCDAQCTLATRTWIGGRVIDVRARWLRGSRWIVRRRIARRGAARPTRSSVSIPSSAPTTVRGAMKSRLRCVPASITVRRDDHDTAARFVHACSDVDPFSIDCRLMARARTSRHDQPEGFALRHASIDGHADA